MSLQVNKFLHRNKVIASNVISGEALKVSAYNYNISIERCRQITYDTLSKAGVVWVGSYREFSEKQIKEALAKIKGLK